MSQCMGRLFPLFFSPAESYGMVIDLQKKVKNHDSLCINNVSLLPKNVFCRKVSFHLGKIQIKKNSEKTLGSMS